MIFTVSFLPRSPACPFSLTCPFLPCNRDPLLLAPPTCSPLVIGNPINRNLSNPPTQTTSISLETAPSTTNHAFTQTALIPRGLFFKIVTSLVFDKTPTDRAYPPGISSRWHICSRSGTERKGELNKLRRCSCKRNSCFFIGMMRRFVEMTPEILKRACEIIFQVGQ